MTVLEYIQGKRLNIKIAIREALEAIATVVSSGYTDEVGAIQVVEVDISAADVIPESYKFNISLTLSNLKHSLHEPL